MICELLVSSGDGFSFFHFSWFFQVSSISMTDAPILFWLWLLMNSDSHSRYKIEMIIISIVVFSIYTGNIVLSIVPMSTRIQTLSRENLIPRYNVYWLLSEYSYLLSLFFLRLSGISPISDSKGWYNPEACTGIYKISLTFIYFLYNFHIALADSLLCYSCKGIFLCYLLVNPLHSYSSSCHGANAYRHCEWCQSNRWICE